MKRFDSTVLLGLAVGVAAIIGAAWLEDLQLKFLWHPTAALVVFGGTLGAVVVRRGANGVLSAAKAVLNLRFADDENQHKIELARLAWLERAVQQKGVRVLESHAEAANDALVAHGLLLVAEHTDIAKLRQTLDRELDAEDERGLQDAATLEAAGGFAPTFGILGAVLGLIGVLRVLDRPEVLGVGIATAFVATVYGIAAANLFFFPLAARLRARHENFIKRREEIAAVIVALGSGETSRAITNRFNLKISNG